MSLVTRCPKCQSAFEVSTDLLKLHDGLVRCGQCSHVFDGFANLQAALPTLTRKVQSPASAPSQALSQAPTPTPTQTAVSEAPPPEPPAPAQPAAPSVFRAPVRRPQAPERMGPTEPSWSGVTEPSVSGAPDFDEEPKFRLPSSDEEDFSGSPVRIIGETRLKGDDPSAFGRSLPEFMEQEPEPAPWAKPLWALLSLLMLVALIAQLLFVFRGDLAAASPGMRNVLTELCKPLGCEVYYPRRIERVFIVGSSLQQAAAATSTPGEQRYLLRLTLQNRFDQDQQWPTLMVQLSDSSGTPVIRKALAPSQYLPADLVGQPFKSRQELSLEIPLSVSGQAISGFELTKFFP
jgi:predicted Zn finger-like uncharacterized protein